MKESESEVDHEVNFVALYLCFQTVFLFLAPVIRSPSFFFPFKNVTRKLTFWNVNLYSGQRFLGHFKLLEFFSTIFCWRELPGVM